MKVCFLVGSLRISGGNIVILQHASYLQRQGVHVSICTLDPEQGHSGWHPALAELRIFQLDSYKGEHFDVAFATLWESVYFLSTLSADVYAYFVQSIESLFFPGASNPVRELVERTYGLGLPTITEAGWIRDYLRRYGGEALLARNGILKGVHTHAGPVLAPPAQHKLRVLVEGPFGVPFKQTARTLRLLAPLYRQKLIETWLLTGTSMPRRYPGVERVFSRVPVEETAAVYRSCDVLVKLSLVEGMFGPPLEMFHCGGTAVVYNVTGCEEYIVDGENALVLAKGDEQGVVDAVRLLASRRDYLERLKGNALQTARSWPDWDKASEAFYKHTLSLSQQPCPTAQTIRQHTATALDDFRKKSCGPPPLPGHGPQKRCAAKLKRGLGPAAPWLRLAKATLWESRLPVAPELYSEIKN